MPRREPGDLKFSFGGDDRTVQHFDRSDKATTDCGCGYSIINPASDRIVGGREVNPIHSRPYQVRLQISYESGIYLCGATILNKRYILSAMHCVEMKNEVFPPISTKAIFGEHDLVKEFETKVRTQTIEVAEYITTPDYSPASYDNDIIILKMAREIQFSDYVLPACLPSSSSSQFYGREAIVSGWGDTKYDGWGSRVLKETTVKVVPPTDRTCKFTINSNIQMCAYAPGTDSCQGDSGGPLVVRENGRETVIGVVSYGEECAKPGSAGVYARVAGYLTWINSNIKDGWCDGSGNTTPPTTTQPPVSNLGPACDLSCTANGLPDGNYLINGVDAICTKSQCKAKDGSDICKAINFPCGKSSGESELKCMEPCDMSRYLAQLMRMYEQGIYSRYSDVRFYGIMIRCDLELGTCCSKGYPNVNLCSLLGLSG
eukprot:TRINITY_DN5503_c0_g1_i2.p1 TRINITY_DN5503_c0_g1~~TRINITY_DN5503_c0_g1_i2.p1  ORF type:complete len:482 (-),score=63.80 TRINITY_DN5503_c0_g1_i2:92-1381(-)